MGLTTINRMIDKYGKTAYIGDVVGMIRFESNYYLYFGMTVSHVLRLSSGVGLEYWATWNDKHSTPGWVPYNWLAFDKLLKEDVSYVYTEDLKPILRKYMGRSFNKTEIEGLPSLVRKAKKFVIKEGYYYFNEEAL